MKTLKEIKHGVKCSDCGKYCHGVYMDRDLSCYYFETTEGRGNWCTLENNVDVELKYNDEEENYPRTEKCIETFGMPK